MEAKAACVRAARLSSVEAGMSYGNCKLGAVQTQDHRWGFNVLTYETEAKAQEAHALMAKVIAGAAIAPHS